MSEQYQFIVRKGPKVGQVFRLLQDSISIGRDPLSDIVLNDPEISRHHAKLVRTETGYAIEDFGSTNGSYIDGEKINPGGETELLPGQLLSMGSGVILLYGVLSDDPPTPEPFDDSIEQIDTPPTIEPIPEPTPVPTMPEPQPQPTPTPRMAQHQPTTPLVPSSDSTGGGSSRTRMVVVLIVLIALCLLFTLSAYFIWGDPLMNALGVY